MLVNDQKYDRTINNISLAWHFFKQEYHYPHQRLLRWVQAVLLIFIITLSLSSDSIQHYLQQNLQGLLGADAVISQQQAISNNQAQDLAKLANKVVLTQQITTTLTYQNRWQQAQLKAVSNDYPLQGELLISQAIHGQGEVVNKGPEVGQIWLDTRLIASLGITIGEQLTISDTQFMVSAVLQHEPDRLMEGHSVAMRAMIHVDDMKVLAFPADLIQHRYLVAIDNAKIPRLMEWQKQVLPAAHTYHKQGRHPLALFWQRTENFIGLASIILFFMAAIAIEQLAQLHMKKDQYFSAVCMSLGASKTTGIYISIIKWLMAIVMLLPLVLMCSVAFHFLVVNFLNTTFADLNWHINVIGMLKPIGAVLIIFAVFHAPVWFALLNSTVANQLSGEQKQLSHWLGKVSHLAILTLVAIAYSDNLLLTSMLLFVVVITILLMIVVSWGSLTLGEKLTQQVSGIMPFAFYMMKQRLVNKSTQILGIGLCAFLLLFTLMLLKDLGATMTSYKRQHDGNVFISQANQQQMDHIKKWANDENIKIRQTKPYMHARLLNINGQSLSEFSDQPSESLSTFSKSIRLHWSESIPNNNRLVQGQWWQINDINWQQVSIEQEVMTDLGLVIGDQLTFYINKKHYQFEITASHEFKPGAGSITFWVQMPPTALAQIEAATYNMASIELNDEQWPLLAPLWQKFPTLRMVSLKEVTQLFDRTLAMITQVISGFSVMIILLSGVVMLASIHALESKEKRKNSVILSFGFTRATCLKLNIIEWLVTASISAAGAMIGTYIAGILIYQSQFSLPYQPNVIWLTVTLLTILITMTVLGVYASRKSLRSSVRELMVST